MEFQITTPSTITVRRNPRRKARDTPSSNAPDLPATTPKLSAIKPLSLEEILEPEPEPNPPQIPPSLSKPSDDEAPQNLSVFLRIRPLFDLKPGPKKKSPNRGPKSKAELEKDKLKNKKKKIPDKQAICLAANDSHSVTLTVPPSLNESKRKKSEIYDGFSHVFTADSLQSEVYERVMEPLVSDFIKGKNRLLAALGPTGSGKTHTVFGCPREPGLVPLSLRRIFDQSSGIGGSSKVPRSLYLSMFEICSERGKGERISDLSTDVADLCFQQSTIKGVKEVMVTDITQAECFISCGLLKRTTAATNSNNQSSRSQCIINIRSSSAMHGDEDGFAQNDAVLTIVDLAGAERERRTGIQGARLLESNFINNTSMIFGLCLRSLLEHQKNPKKPLEKHFQNSLLTKYLRDYLEGKKRMTLILTAKAGEDDYVDTSFLLRHASPYMKIKFLNTEELPNMPCQKRHIPSSNRTNKLKRRKCNDVETVVGSSEIGGKCGKGVFETVGNGGNVIEEQLQELDLQQDLVSPLLSNMELQRVERKNRIMQDFSKALWNVLKQYKKKLEVSENEVQSLQESLRNEKVLFLDMEKQLNKLKSSCSCHARSSRKMSSNSEVISTSSSCVDSYTTKEASEHNSNRAINDPSFRQNLEVISTSSSCVDSYSTKEASEHNSNRAINDPSFSQNLEVISRSSCVDSYSTKEASEHNSNRAINDPSFRQNLEVISTNSSGADGYSTKKGSEHRNREINDTSVRQNLDMGNSNEVVRDSKLSTTEFKCENYESLDLKAESFNAIECTAEDLAGLEVSGKSPIVDTTGCKLSVPSVTPCDLHVLDQEGSCVLVPYLDKNILSDAMDNDRSQLLLGSQELPASDVERSNRCQALCANGEKKHLNVEKPRRKLLPASTMLVKEVGAFDMEDDNPKNNKRAENMATVDGRRQTHGSVSLLRLLRNNLYP
ncbi:kinesin-like protein KIN-6 isoform X4 [Cinnamomum micranthum f. kanehirae]|uniref:Kinesin-like protein KIN-6 isoform X4 n=1 Tax=Cinnamomum micranthum f. kanehirae TaxID=337451 RepID=A0A443PNH0_9MAGN|nr:kinesin-like protein KIN-6 isoform X4 [Cinnamomum micranthum f. kanehirae]